jgi:3-oxoacyl-[acyl-carrier-protein] synthase III
MPELHICGLGAFLPKTVAVADRIREAGGDASIHDGWPRVGVASDAPSVMAKAALEEALQNAQVAAKDLALVIYCGVSRDHPPSWSVATEVMRLLAIPETCFGLDLSAGCLGPLAALETARGWLAGKGGGHAAIVSAERWTHTIDYKNPADQALFSHADGASAAVVSLDPQRSLARYVGSCFSSHARYNALITVNEGGTRKMEPRPKSEIYSAYVSGYSRVIADAKARFGSRVDQVACTQVSPLFTQMMSTFVGVDKSRVTVTGTELGHVGSADLFLGLRQRTHEGRIFLAGSTGHSFGVSVLESTSGWLVT